MGSNQKTFGEVDCLASIVTSPDFNVSQLAGFRTSGASCFFDWSENQEDKGPYTGDTDALLRNATFLSLDTLTISKFICRGLEHTH